MINVKATATTTLFKTSAIQRTDIDQRSDADTAIQKYKRHNNKLNEIQRTKLKENLRLPSEAYGRKSDVWITSVSEFGEF